MNQESLAKKTHLSKFDYNLPESLIAQTHAKPRDRSRLFVCGEPNQHDFFYNIEKYLPKNSVLVLNNTKVFPARLYGKKETGGKVEVLLLEDRGDSWHAMAKPTKRLRVGSKLFFEGMIGEIMEKLEDGSINIKFDVLGDEFWEVVNRIGHTPLPPYINSASSGLTLRPPLPARSRMAGGLTEGGEREEAYQTVYAKCRGSAAAPTAGLHFTSELLEQMKKSGIEIEHVTLHVGLGTFMPVKTEFVEDHKIHSERYFIEGEVWQRLQKYKSEKRPIIAVGTTSVRVLETLANQKRLKLAGETSIYITPGYKFKMIDGMITNFHLPKSSLLMLISAFAGREKILSCYQEAIDKKYRFYSFGDAMFIMSRGMV